MAHTIEEHGARRDGAENAAARLDRLADEVYRTETRGRLGEEAPPSLDELLESRGLAPGIGALMRCTVASVLALPETRRLEAEAALTGAEAEVLRDGAFDLSEPPEADGPLARGVARFASLIATSLSTVEASERLRVNPSRIRQRLGEGSLFGFKLADDWKVPAFQFADDGLVPGIGQVVSSLPNDLHPVAVATWFETPNPDLVDEASGSALTPLQWLRLGLSPEVVAELAVHL